MPPFWFCHGNRWAEARRIRACSKMLISHLVNIGRNFPSSLLRWQNGLGTAWPGREPEVKRPKNMSTLRVCLPATLLSWQFHGFWTARRSRADSVRDTVNRVGRRRWKRSSVALSAAASTTSIERMAWTFIGLRGRRNFDNVWAAALRLQSLVEKLRKFVEKIQTTLNERSIDGQRSVSGEKQKISTHLLLEETLRGRLVMSKKSLNAVKNK